MISPSASGRAPRICARRRRRYRRGTETERLPRSSFPDSIAALRGDGPKGRGGGRPIRVAHAKGPSLSNLSDTQERPGESPSPFYVKFEPTFFTATGRFALEYPRHVAAVVKRGSASSASNSMVSSIVSPAPSVHRALGQNLTTFVTYSLGRDRTLAPSGYNRLLSVRCNFGPQLAESQVGGTTIRQYPFWGLACFGQYHPFGSSRTTEFCRLEYRGIQYQVVQMQSGPEPANPIP